MEHTNTHTQEKEKWKQKERRKTKKRKGDQEIGKDRAEMRQIITLFQKIEI